MDGTPVFRRCRQGWFRGRYGTRQQAVGELSRTRTQTLNRLHRLLAELVPGGAARHLTALQAKTLLASVRPRDLPGRTRRELAVELIGEVQALDGKLKALTGRLRQAVTQPVPGLWTSTGSALRARRGSWLTSATWPASPTATDSPPGPAPPRSTPPPAPISATGSPAPATGGPTTSSTSPRMRFAQTFVTADPRGARPADRAQLVDALPKRRAMFEAAGVSGLRLDQADETPLDEDYILVQIGRAHV